MEDLEGLRGGAGKRKERGETAEGRGTRNGDESGRATRSVRWDVTSGGWGYLIHQRIGPLLPRLLRVGHDDNPFCHPVVWWLLAADRPLAAADAQLALQLLDKSVLRVALVYDDGPHFAAQQPVPEHGVHVLGLLGTADDRLQLQKVDGQRVERREQEAGTATRWGLQKTSDNFRGPNTLQLCQSTNTCRLWFLLPAAHAA